MRLRALLVATILAGLGSARPHPVWSQTLIFQRPRGEVGADFDGFWIGFPQSPQQTIRTYQEWVRVQLAGAVGSPGLFAYAVGLQPTRVQSRWNNSLAAVDGGADRVDVNARATAFAAAPVALSLRRIRSREHQDGVFGTEFRTLLSETGAGLSFRLPYLPGDIDYGHQLRDAIYRTGGQQVIRQAETVRTLRVTAQNSKLNTFLEHLSFEDHALGRDFKQDRAVLSHALPWGKRSSLSSVMQYLDRVGAFPFRLATWSERLHLQHTWKLASDHQYRRYSQRSEGFRSDGQSGRIGLGYQIHPTLFVGTEGLGQSDRFGLGRRTLYRERSEVRYSVDLPFRSRLALGVAGGYAWQRQEPSLQASVTVVNEPHVIDASQKFLLDEPFADASSVVATSADETITYQDGFDYRLVAAGGLLEVLVLPGGRIAVGDTVLVDYRYDQLPGGRASALIAEYGVDLQADYVTLYHRRSRLERQDGGGSARLLVNRDDAVTGLRLSRRLATGVVDFAAEHQRRKSDFYDFTSDELRGSFTKQLIPTVRGAFGAGVNWSRGGGPAVTLGSVNLSAEWTPLAALELTGRLAAWKWSQDGVQSQRFTGGGVEAKWRIGQARLELQYDGGWWNEGFEHTQNRVLVRVRRGF